MSVEPITKAVLSIATAGLSTWLERRKARRLRQRLLLAVEDNPSDIWLMESLLKQVAVEFDIKPDAEEALSCYYKRHHQIVLVDMRLPLMDGWDLAEKIRRDDPRVHVVLVAGDPADLGKARTGQYFGMILKPVTLESIQHLLLKTK